MKELLLLSGLGIFSLFAEIINIRKIVFPIILLGLLATIFFCITDIISIGNGNQAELVYGMMLLDNTALLFTLLSSIIAFFWFVMAHNFIKNDTHLIDNYALILFSLVGALLLVSFTHFSVLFLGIEILSIPLYVLAGSNKRSLFSNEAAFKYFLLGAFASGFLLLGITFIYGTTGTFYLEKIGQITAQNIPFSKELFLAGIMLLLFAMLFKVSAFPFHFWTPDVYTGTPTVITSYMATIVKIGAFGALFRLFGFTKIFYSLKITILLMVVGVATILIGNIIATAQSNIKRLLAYSSIGHAGFMILAISMQTPNLFFTIWYYLLAYTSTSLLAFWVIIIVTENDNNRDLSVFKGLIKRNPFLAIVLTIALLSMAGIPPLSGFFAKYFVLMNLIGINKVFIAILAIIASLIGVYYYFKIIINIFNFEEADNYEKIQINISTKIMLLLLTLLVIVSGIFPDFLFQIFK